MTSAVVTCLHAGRKVRRKHRKDKKPHDRAGTHRGKGGGRQPTGLAKEKHQKTTSLHHQRTHSNEPTGSGGTDSSNQGMRQEKEPRAGATG